MAENWLALAPKPPPLAPGKLWHVYISYRSVNCSWALALYDVLNDLGYKTFLDQYVLTAAAPLAVSLGEALDASQSAILVWSSRYEDSEWLQDQFATLELLQNAKKGFRYVVARVDDATMPGFAAHKLWIDFSEQPEGPAGNGLLSLLCGLQGLPLRENIECHMLACSHGIAIVENQFEPELNPNVAMEWGCMRAMRKPVLYLVEKSMEVAPADVAGLIKERFDWLNPQADIPELVNNYLRQA